MFVNFSQVNSSLVPLILNTATFKRSPQYHVVFDDKFATINLLPTEDSLDNQWARIFKLDRDFHVDIAYDSSEDSKRMISLFARKEQPEATLDSMSYTMGTRQPSLSLGLPKIIVEGLGLSSKFTTVTATPAEKAVLP